MPLIGSERPTMNPRAIAARAISSISHKALRILGRPAANFPGKIALYVDPSVIANVSASKLSSGSVVVVGTNGKTTTTNLIADMLAEGGNRAICNRTGANLDSGVATALLQSPATSWGVFECDEMWSAKVVAQLQPTYFVLLNLFRDQLDRCGEIDFVQDKIASGLISSPETVLIYNADDPFCQAIADKVPNPRIAFGIDHDLALPQNTVADGQMCQECHGILEYDYRQYGQLGAYRCPKCGFARPSLDIPFTNVSLDGASASFTVKDGSFSPLDISVSQGSHYMVYNMGAAAATAQILGTPRNAILSAISKFAPENGRMQEIKISQRRVLLNLAKNPTGFNQSIKLALQDGSASRAIAFFINDKEADGHDVSWLWDVDFEELSDIENLRVFAGGKRAYDMQVRLKYAGVESQVIGSVRDMMSLADEMPPDTRFFAIANYTALPKVKTDLEALAQSGIPRSGTINAGAASSIPSPADDGDYLLPRNPVVLFHMLPDLLNLYGDGGNMKVLEKRLEWRGIPVMVRNIYHGQSCDFDEADLVLLGGSPDREQVLAGEDLLKMRDGIARYVDEGGPLLAICGSYQLMGKSWTSNGEDVECLRIFDISTDGNGTQNRLIDNIAIQTEFSFQPLVGYENHQGRTYLNENAHALGRVVSHTGSGNNGADGTDGVILNNAIGTYLHGPILSKNPELADWLLGKALERHAERTGETISTELEPLSDIEEKKAREEMLKRIGGFR